MTYPTVRAKIVKMEDGSGYEGKVYDQYVFIELSDGKIIGLFDPDMSASPDLLNKVKDITVDAILAFVDKVPEPKFGVESPISEEGKYHPPSSGHVFFGKIEKIYGEHYNQIVDIGVGKIMVSPIQIEKHKSFKIGDFVKIFGSRADLFRVYD
jgi:hypothetical protein